MTKPDADGRTVALLITHRVDADSWSSHGPTLRVTARPVWITTDGDVRNPDGSGYNEADIALAALESSAFLDADSAREGRHLYAAEIRYLQPYSMDLRQAKVMAATLARIARHLDKVASRYGPPDSFGAHLARFAEAIGARSVIRYRDPVATYSRDYQTWTPADLPFLVSSRESEFRRSLEPAEVAS